MIGYTPRAQVRVCSVVDKEIADSPVERLSAKEIVGFVKLEVRVQLSVEQLDWRLRVKLHHNRETNPFHYT